MDALRLIALALLLALATAARAADPDSDEFWYGTAADGTPTVRLYYFYSPTPVSEHSAFVRNLKP